MKVTVIPIVISAPCTVTKGLVQGLDDLEIKGQVETIKQEQFWDRPEYWEKSWGLEWETISQRLCEKYKME